MRTLVVFCHPLPHSYGEFLHRRIVEATRNATETESIDLYDGNELPATFDPDRHGPALVWSDALVLVYPTWWSSLPAPLMAWLEKALERELLAGVRLVVAVTTHGSSRMLNLLTGGIGRRIVRRGLPAHLAGDARTVFVALYSMDRIGDDRRRRFAASAARRVARLVRSPR